MPRLIVTSDWHADWNTAGAVRFDDVRDAVMQVVDACRSDDVFMFLGDLTDPESLRANLSIKLAVQVASELKSRDVCQFWIPGNHDVVEDGYGSSTLSALEAMPGVDAYSRPKVVQDSPSGITVVALPFTPRAFAYDPEAFVRSAVVPGDADPERIVVISHLNVEGIGPGSETVDMPRGRDVFLPREAIRERWPKALILNGHYHRRQVFDGVHVPGSLVRLMFSEEHNKPGFLIVEV